MENELLKYHHEIRLEKHVFVYSVAGRSSSTALQRLLNSSNEVFIWGEPHYIIDEIAEIMQIMKFLENSPGVQRSRERIQSCFISRKHDKFYPNAIGNLESSMEILPVVVSNLLRPAIDNIRRFGYKEIRIRSINTLKVLQDIYPNSFILFCFRNPVSQWGSVNKVQWWDYSDDPGAFIEEYIRLADIYLEYQKISGNGYFIESDDLRNAEKMKFLFSLLDIGSMDNLLTDTTISTAGHQEISPDVINIIEDSECYRRYSSMKEISDSHFLKY